MTIETAKSAILEHLQSYSIKTGGHCGVSPASLKKILGVDYKIIRESLQELHKEKRMIVKKGINGWLLFHKKTLLS